MRLAAAIPKMNLREDRVEPEGGDEGGRHDGEHEDAQPDRPLGDVFGSTALTRLSRKAPAGETRARVPGARR